MSNFEKIFKELLGFETLGGGTSVYDWKTVEEELKKLKVFQISQVAELAKTKHGHSQARQYIERWVRTAVDQQTGVTKERNADGKFIRFRANDGSVYYMHVDVFEEQVKKE